MRKEKKRIIFWAISGMVLSLCVLITVICGLNNPPKFLANPANVIKAAEEVLDCAHSGDLDALEQMLYGTPSLGDAPTMDDSAQSVIWYAYKESIQYSLSDTPEATDTGVSLDAKITCLDISAVMDALKTVAPALMAEKANQTDNEDEIYDESHNYRESFVSGILQEATTLILQNQPQTMEQEMTLQFVRQDGKWQIVPTEELVQLLTGFVSE